jgi:hypothetical protein
MSLTLKYDSVGDILYITKVPPDREQESEVGEDILARINPPPESSKASRYCSGRSAWLRESL